MQQLVDVFPLCYSLDYLLQEESPCHQTATWCTPSKLAAQARSTLTFRSRIQALTDPQLRQRLLQPAHDSIPAGHWAKTKLSSWLQRTYSWPEPARDVPTYM